MIDKKPFRVENEKVKNWAKTTYEVPKNASVQDICFLAAFIAAHEMAADLLDARELIDKQEALLKEAVAIIDHAIKYGIDNACSCDDCKKADSFLEKTKDYA